MGSESELAFLHSAKNIDVEFCLRQCSMEACDEAGRCFFEQGVWEDLTRDTVEVLTVREKLSEILFDQIKSELPTLIDNIKGQISDCLGTMARLGQVASPSNNNDCFFYKSAKISKIFWRCTL